MFARLLAGGWRKYFQAAAAALALRRGILDGLPMSRLILQRRG